jgi:hypothetical protein
MKIDATELLTAAEERSGVSLSLLTDAVLGEYAIPTEEQRRESTYVSDPKSHDTLTGSISSVLAYATGNEDGDLVEVANDCADSADMVKFMRSVLDILLEDPRTFASTTGYVLDSNKLTAIRRAI